MAPAIRFNILKPSFPNGHWNAAPVSIFRSIQLICLCLRFISTVWQRVEPMSFRRASAVLVCGDSLPFLKSLGDLPYVLKTELVYIEPDSLKPFECPRRTKTFDELKGDDDATREQLEQIHLNALHKAGFRGKGILVAVLDGGFQYADHIPALKRINKVGERDFVFPPSHNIYREHSHGMKVLSVMAVHEKGIFEGSAPEADYWLLRCEQTETESRSEEDFWAAAAEFADSAGVDVINSSLGYSEYDDEEQNYGYRHLDGHTMMISRMASIW